MDCEDVVSFDPPTLPPALARNLMDGNPEMLWALPQRTDAWHEARLHRITGSRLYSLLSRKDHDSVFAKMSGLEGPDVGMPPPDSFQGRLIQYGVEMEPAGQHIATHLLNEPVVDIGLLVSPVEPWRAGSVDGITTQAFVEVKTSMRSPVYPDIKDYHRDQIAWNCRILNETLPQYEHQWPCLWVGYGSRESKYRMLERDTKREEALLQQTRFLWKYYVDEYCPAHRVTLPDWARKARWYMA